VDQRPALDGTPVAGLPVGVFRLQDESGIYNKVQGGLVFKSDVNRMVLARSEDLYMIDEFAFDFFKTRNRLRCSSGSVTILRKHIHSRLTFALRLHASRLRGEGFAFSPICVSSAQSAAKDFWLFNLGDFLQSWQFWQSSPIRVDPW
jgi:hypothetical protein